LAHRASPERQPHARPRPDSWQTLRLHVGQKHPRCSTKELSDCNGSQLLKGFGEIAFKVLSETFAFTFSNSVSTKFNNLKSRQEPRTLHNTCCGDTLILSRCKTTHNQENQTTYQDPHAHASMFHVLPSFRCVTRTSFCRAPFARPFVWRDYRSRPKFAHYGHRYLARVNVTIQFVSHVFPASNE
jgi:hypothetical protein